MKISKKKHVKKIALVQDAYALVIQKQTSKDYTKNNQTKQPDLWISKQCCLAFLL